VQSYTGTSVRVTKRALRWEVAWRPSRRSTAAGNLKGGSFVRSRSTTCQVFLTPNFPLKLQIAATAKRIPVRCVGLFDGRGVSLEREVGLTCSVASFLSIRKVMFGSSLADSYQIEISVRVGFSVSPPYIARDPTQTASSRISKTDLIQSKRSV
jgi:hypothetical protein